MSPAPRPPLPSDRPPRRERPDLALLAIWAAFATTGFLTALWALARSLAA
ncbi:MAG: hypothetical protein R2761_28115 [Acidimicrobiales bacterium]